MVQSDPPTDDACAVYDVAIVGLGPVGAAMALQLARAGLRVVVVERSTEAVQLPRAVMLDGESLRAFERIGLADEVHAIVQPSREPDTVCFTDSQREVIFGLDFPRLGPNGWCDMHFFDQPEFETLLRRMVADEPHIDLRLGHEVTAIEQDADSVRLQTTDVVGAAGSRCVLRANWAVGCDGAASFVRDAVGIGWNDLGYDQDWLVIDVVQKPECRLPLATMQVCDPQRLTTYVCCKDPLRRWEFQLLPGETREAMLRPEKIEELLRPWAPPEHYELTRAAVYQFHAATAEKWRAGRVFLAGDAAHQTPPFLGQGLNTGLRDALNLAWKIVWVQEGRSDGRLLDRYFEERDPHARDLVEWAVEVGRLMEALAAKEAGLEAPPPPERRSAGYGQGRSAPTLKSGVLIEEQVGDDGPAGAIFAQPTLRDESGKETRLDALLGSSFAVVARDRSAASMSPRSAALLARLGVPVVDMEGYEVVGGALDGCLEKHGAALVRPDRYVFGVTDANWSLDRLIESLAEKLALRSSGLDLGDAEPGS